MQVLLGGTPHQSGCAWPPNQPIVGCGSGCFTGQVLRQDSILLPVYAEGPLRDPSAGSGLSGCNWTLPEEAPPAGAGDEMGTGTPRSQRTRNKSAPPSLSGAAADTELQSDDVNKKRSSKFRGVTKHRRSGRSGGAKGERGCRAWVDIVQPPAPALLHVQRSQRRTCPHPTPLTSHPCPHLTPHTLHTPHA